MADLTRERLRQILHYDSETGKFTRLDRMTARTAGTLAGGKGSGGGYVKISIDGKLYLAHRLAWLYEFGEWPSELDHRDRNRSNNRISNLRSVTRGQNCVNGAAMPSNTTGYRGVHFHKGAGRYRAQITKDGCCHSLGYFDDPKIAYEAYRRAVSDLHGIDRAA